MLAYWNVFVLWSGVVWFDLVPKLYLLFKRSTKINHSQKLDDFVDIKLHYEIVIVPRYFFASTVQVCCYHIAMSALSIICKTLLFSKVLWLWDVINWPHDLWSLSIHLLESEMNYWKQYYVFKLNLWISRKILQKF